MLHYRVLHAINLAYPLAVFWTYVLAFVTGCTFMFIFPQVTLALVFLALFGLIVVVIAARVLGELEGIVARGILAAGSCPACGARVEPEKPDATRCAACGRVYTARGAEFDASTTPPTTMA